MMIKSLHLNHLVDWENHYLAYLGFIISGSSINYVSTLWPCFWIVSKAVTGLLLLWITKHWSPTTNMFTCESNFVLVLTNTILSKHWTVMFAHWQKIQQLHQHISFWCPLLMTLGVSWVFCACHPITGILSWDLLCFSTMLLLWECLPLSSWYHSPQVEN